MALSNREILLVMRARDEMSGVINKNATSLTALGNSATLSSGKMLAAGAAFTATGGILKSAGESIVGFGVDSVNAAVEAGRVNALIATQAQNLGLSVEQVNDIITKVGTVRNTPIDGLRESLFEILSTVETDVPGAIKILDSLGMSGVAGSTSSADFAGLLTASLNAFKLEAEDSNRVMDAVFRAYEQGQGSLTNFSSAFATAVPSAQAFGQTLEDTFGSVAFVTKATGLSESEAGTAVARAFDLFKKGKVRASLEDIGVAVTDVGGEFRGIVPIMSDMEKALGGLTAEARESELERIFGANVRAFRFLNPAIDDMDAFRAVLDEVNTGLAEGSGILGAYDIMMAETSTGIQGAKNAFQFLKEEVGRALLPVLEKGLEIFKRLSTAWNNLSEETRDVIIKIVAFVGVVALVIGTIAVFVGGIATAIAIFSLLGVTFTAVAGYAALVIGVFLAVVAAGIALGLNWEWVKATALSVWEAITTAWNTFKDAFTSGEASITGGGFYSWLEKIALFIKDTVIPALITAGEIFMAFGAFVVQAGILIGQGMVWAWEKLKEFFNWAVATFGPGLTEIWNTVKTEFMNVAEAFQETVAFFSEKLNELWGLIQSWWAVVSPFWSEIWQGIQDSVQIALDFVKSLWSAWAPEIINIIQRLWDQVVVIVTTFVTIFSNVIQLFLAVIRGDWSAAWDAIKAIFEVWKNAVLATIRNFSSIARSLFNMFKAFVITVFNAVKDIIIRMATAAMDGLKRIISSGIAQTMNLLRALPGKIRGVFSGASSWLYNAGKNILGGLISGITNKIGAVKSKLSELTGLIPSWKGPPAKDAKMLVGAGNLIMDGLVEGLDQGFGNVQRFLGGVPISGALNLPASGGSNQQSNPNTEMLRMLERLLAEQTVNKGLHVEGDLVLGNEGAIDDLDAWSRNRFSGV